MSALPNQFESQLAQWESDSTLLDPSCFPSRMHILDGIDAFLSESGLPLPVHGLNLANRIRAFSAKLNLLNDHLFASVRREIKTGIFPSEFQRHLRHFASDPPSGQAYDYLDDLIAGVLQFEPPPAEPRPLGSDSVFYQPTPARHIFHLITAAAITKTDTLIDLGAGLGHVPLLVSICTGATTVGIELDPAWIASAKNCAGNLSLSNVSFIAQDARVANLSSGTVFYLYTPFIGSTLATVLDALRDQSLLRPIRICTFGPCTLSVGYQRWLTPLTLPATDRITVFLSSPVK